MRKLAALAVIGLALGLPASATAEQTATGATLLVKFAVPPVQVPKLLEPGDKVLGVTLNGVHVIRVRAGVSVVSRIAAYDALPAVVYAERNAVARAHLDSPDDASFSSQWGFAAVDAVDGWAVYPGAYAGSGGPTVAIVDTGVDAAHADFETGRVLAGANCTASSGACTAGGAADDNGHGTHVAGVAAASTNNGAGVAGASYGSPILPVKVLNSSGAGSWAGITNGILWAASHGARVINLSLGGTSPSTTVCDAVQRAAAGGAVVVASAGNSSTTTPNYPAACPGAIGVSATAKGDGIASFSNTGSPNVFVSAPGDSIYSTWRGGGYRTMSGTSMAAPLVSGLSALLLGQLPARTPTQVKQLLATTSDKVGGAGYGSDPYSTCAECTWSPTHGYGRVDFERALRVAVEDFTISASPAVVSVAAGGTASYTVSVASIGGFGGTVALAASGAPAGATTTFTPPTIAAAGSSELRIATSVATLPGAYNVTITGASGSRSRSTTVTLVVAAAVPLPPTPPVPPVPVNPPVLPPPPPPPPVPSSDFGLAVVPGTMSTARGLTASYAIAVSGQLGSGSVKLSVAGTPPGSTVAFAPSAVTAPGASTLTIVTSLATPPGTYVLTITGENGGVSKSAVAVLGVL